MNMFNKCAFLFILLLISSFNSSATVIGYCNDVGTVGDAGYVAAAVGGNGLSTGDVTLTDAEIAGGAVVYGSPAPAISATNCAGLFIGNDTPLPNPDNLGLEDQGYMNGEDFSFFDGGAFITDDYLQDLDDDGFINDPGWVYLGKDEGAGEDGIDLENPAGVDLDLFMNIIFTCESGEIGAGEGEEDCYKGSWAVNFTDPGGLLAALEPTVFGDSFFDHLAFTFKFAKSFAVYDFDFNILNSLSPDPLNPIFDLSAPHNLGGDFDLSAYGKGISHITVSARDPLNVEEIPEPSMYLLVLIGVFSIYIGMRLR